jgi:hypothetical protein
VILRVLENGTVVLLDGQLVMKDAAAAGFLMQRTMSVAVSDVPNQEVEKEVKLPRTRTRFPTPRQQLLNTTSTIMPHLQLSSSSASFFEPCEFHTCFATARLWTFYVEQR